MAAMAIITALRAAARTIFDDDAASSITSGTAPLLGHLNQRDY